jgi:hypothetical protein
MWHLPWLYVGLRVVHSLVQAITNTIVVRFSVFMIASVVVLMLAVRAVQTHGHIVRQGNVDFYIIHSRYVNWEES